MNDPARERKLPPVTSWRYEAALKSAGIFMDLSRHRPQLKDAGMALCQQLLNTQQPLPTGSLFEDALFDTTNDDGAFRNEARVVRDIGPLIVASAENLHRRSAKGLEHLIDTINERWSTCTPLLSKSVPQPDFSVGLKPTAFTAEQREKLQLSPTDEMDPDGLMFFPFLAAEVKSGNQLIRVADRQTLHCGSVAANAVVQLYRAINRQHELNREVLGFSISHNHNMVCLWAHYAVIDGDTTQFYRHQIDGCSTDVRGGRETWTGYKFTKNVCETFGPIHIKRIRDAADELPGPETFEQDQLPDDESTKSTKKGAKKCAKKCAKCAKKCAKNVAKTRTNKITNKVTKRSTKRKMS